MDATAIIAAGSAAIAATSVALAASDYRRTAHGQRLSLLRDARDELRSDRIRKARQRLSLPEFEATLSEGVDPFCCWDSNNVSEDELLLSDLLGFYEYLGVLVARKALDVGDVESIFPNSPLDVWYRALPYILRQRQRPGVRYAEHFEQMTKAYRQKHDCTEVTSL